MNINQHQAVIDQAKNKTGGADEGISIDAQAGDPEGFDETSEGVWVRAWVWVPKEAIPDYQAQPPSPAAVVTVEQPMHYTMFRHEYIKAYQEGDGETPDEAAIQASWAAYQRNPAGHFLSKEKP